MNKLFVFQNKKELKSGYNEELHTAYKLLKKHKDKAENVSKINLNKLRLSNFLDNKVDVVISNGLPLRWYFLLRGLGVISITLDKLKKFREYADIVVDWRSDEKTQNLTGEDYSLKNSNFNFGDIANLITILKWDSEFFNKKIAYLSCRNLTENIISKINKFVNDEKLDLIEYLCNCHDKKSVTIAEKNNFHFTDIRLTFEKTIDKRIDVVNINRVQFRLANKKDILLLKKISADLYLQSRYYFDSNFEKSRIGEFYETWVEKAVLGEHDDECYILVKNNRPIGYCSIKYLWKANSATIGICAIAKDFQRNGFGKILISLVCNAMLEKKINKIYVVTQGRNYQAQRLYQNCGFITRKTELWYHKWV